VYSLCILSTRALGRASVESALGYALFVVGVPRLNNQEGNTTMDTEPPSNGSDNVNSASEVKQEPQAGNQPDVDYEQYLKEVRQPPEDNTCKWIVTGVGCLLITPFLILLIAAILPFTPVLILIGLTMLGAKLLGLEKQ